MIIFLCGKIEKVTLASITGLLRHCYNVSTLVTCTCRLCKLSRCNFYGTFAFKRAIAHMRYVVK